MQNLFFTALSFYTRIPVPRSTRYDEKAMQRSIRYLPLIGWVVAAFSASVFWVFYLLTSTDIAVVISMVGGVLLTGALHEDGFADTCDGFGGGYDTQTRLSILKDSRMGTYGVVGLWLLLTLKFTLIKGVEAGQIPFLFWGAMTWSRLLPVLVIFTSCYARKDQSGKIGAIASGGTSLDVLIAFLGAGVPLFFLPGWISATFVPLTLTTTWFMKLYFERRIGGYTGDCLGAIIQVNETLVYLCYVVIVPHLH